MAENRTLQFLGYAYGNAPVLLNAHINGIIVFSGEVPTIDAPLPSTPGLPGNQTLFSVENSPLFSTDFSGAYPMTISVANGYGVLVGDITCNYMSGYSSIDAVMDNSSISGTTLTVGTLTSGTIVNGQLLSGDSILANTKIISGSGSTWTVNQSQAVTATTITGQKFTQSPGNATEFIQCFNGTPTNSEGTPDPRSSVTIDGVVQVPPEPASLGVWVWEIDPGSTLGYNLNVSLGNVA